MKNTRNNLTLMIVGLMISSTALSQGKSDQGKSKAIEIKTEMQQTGKEAKEKARDLSIKMKSSVKETGKEVDKKSEEVKKDIEKEVKVIKGNAYGKNKGDMEGKVFGQLRSEEAKAKVKAIHADLQSEITKSEDALKSASVKIAQAKDKVAQQYANGELTDELKAEKDKTIKAAEDRLKELENKIKEKKSKLFN